MNLKIGQILKRMYQIEDSILDTSAIAAREQSKKIGEVLIAEKHVDENQFYRALAEQFSMDFMPYIENIINFDLLRDLPFELFKEGRCLPLNSTDQILSVAVKDPLDLDIICLAELLCELSVESVLCVPSEMDRLRTKLLEGDSKFRQSAGKLSKEYERQQSLSDDALSIEEMKQRTEAEPVVKMVSLIFDEAVKLGASDIHIEPSEHNAIVRFRIDGMLRQHTELSKWMYSPFTSRIKILADLDIAEKRVPQDGRIRFSVEGGIFDFRVSTLPTHFGEKTVIRVLKHDMGLLDMRNLGISDGDQELISELIEKPQGMVFVTGPTGSGKSSTLFACLNRIKHKAINITTIENPIEYKLDGVNQVQINEKAGVTFASALRSILRQDPDVILIGEIRDNETAQIAVQSSQTGHLVFSTLHTNDALSAITRLKDLGIPGFLISSSILAVIAQRLVRILCSHCKVETEVNDEQRKKWEQLLGNHPIPRSYIAHGCKACGNIGYKGRMGIFEIITINEKIRTLIAENAPETTIRRVLRENGFKTLLQDGISKVEQGLTSIDELLRVVLIEDIIQQE
jgi:type IV pilus assembly protein PilB